MQLSLWQTVAMLAWAALSAKYAPLVQMLATARTGEMSNCMLSCAVAICEVALEIVAADADRLSGSRQAASSRGRLVAMLSALVCHL